MRTGWGFGCLVWVQVGLSTHEWLGCVGGAGQASVKDADEWTGKSDVRGNTAVYCAVVEKGG